MVRSQWVLDYLNENGAVYTNSHFVFTAGGHGRAYVNTRVVAHHPRFFDRVSMDLSFWLGKFAPDIVIGPETLGRSLAERTASLMNTSSSWCLMEDAPGGGKIAKFKSNIDFGRIFVGKRVAIVDDLLTTGASIKAVMKLVEDHGGIVVAVGVMARRDLEVTEETLGAPNLVTLVDIEGFVTYSDEEDCKQNGPCSELVPMRLHPGHGHEWIKSHPGYPVFQETS